MNGAYTSGGHHHPYSAGPVGPVQAYHASPYAQPNAYGQQADYLNQNRKRQVRATQACNSCRQRKQKCDEQRPCQFCRDSNIKCEYREVPPPKQDRTLTDITSKLNSVLNELHQIKSIHMRLDNIERRLPGGLQHQNGDDQLQTPSDQYPTHSTPLVEDTETGALGPVRENMSQEPVAILPKSRLSKSQSYVFDNVTIGRSPHTRTDFNGTALEDVIETEGEITLPPEHTTGAHQLLSHWPNMAPFFDGIVPNGTNYPRDVEEARGILKIYGRGEGDDVNDGRQMPKVVRQDDSYVSSPAPTSVPQENGWGVGFSTSAGPDTYRLESSHLGGLNPDGTLQLDRKTIRRLHMSYMDNMHTMQPFLDRDSLKEMIERFIARYGNDPVAPLAAFAVPKGTVPLKRKHSSGPGQAPELGSSRKQPQQVERSIGNAIVLLVLALGKICEHKQHLDGHKGGSSTPSPASSHSTLASIPSPSMNDTRFSGSGPTPERNIPNAPTEDQVWNIHVTPGLAYYAYAVEIIGTVHGGNDLSHGQAGVLACLYMGQLARVLESWAWICYACRVAGVLIDREDSGSRAAPIISNSDPGMRVTSARRLNLIKFLYWTCLQLESDILAEMSHLRPTGISKDEDRMGMPNQCLGKQQLDPPEEIAWLFYSSQIMLRKILNRAHLALYSKESRKGSFWARLRNDDLEEQLESWRSTLPKWLLWHDSDDPHHDRNVARLRGKYYGARYIITRPILVTAVHAKNPPTYLLREFISGEQATKPEESEGTWDETKWRKVIGACKRCVDSAVASTIAFDNIESEDNRLIVTNIFGTAHAQFGNILVLSAVRRSWLKDLIPFDKLMYLTDRTISFLRRLEPLSPTLQVDVEVLENTKRIVQNDHEENTSPSDGSFSVHT
ncbi:hypothetical protein K490DRAFT_39241 [Saccharata proteae CBS 121410]|uniref:Zn(2)-C6 fungal-type domain-containing protein n=1 Tax=Saccharata proteae CBS 121410 TaxID=1314787 RepID=A0A9P4LUG2_9PEZI|nr:hypothetical protein K490DRAFT_49968 [Saccharata proteae CBS 121410]KAF2088383.1 hypothetical protein K490DRAFT_39241 [Saccharata proteae CBS 121410]